jgi:hypothetical protein
MGWKSNNKAIGWWCKCKYPIRAKELRDYVFTNYVDSDKTSDKDVFIYCQAGNGGHVYYGTYDRCTIGNNFTAKMWEQEIGRSIDVFSRYEGYTKSYLQ